ncbi:hypothetical protein AVEN_10846-1 [Araneus ventricosus]|uniref:Uncharacterized protein n=1 Tax=Araneus ventricosus TaxID=182803 RepID=A0A4Y2SRL7_ARAVE|nr:hypothetical protein AVEN_10846-1 [Araneus ventricosus]
MWKRLTSRMLTQLDLRCKIDFFNVCVIYFVEKVKEIFCKLFDVFLKGFNIKSISDILVPHEPCGSGYLSEKFALGPFYAIEMSFGSVGPYGTSITAISELLQFHSANLDLSRWINCGLIDRPVYFVLKICIQDQSAIQRETFRARETYEERSENCTRIHCATLEEKGRDVKDLLRSMPSKCTSCLSSDCNITRIDSIGN